MKLRLSTPTDLQKIEKLYFSAFPFYERKPFDALLELFREGKIEFLSCIDGTEFCGFAVVAGLGKVAFLDYFAISEGSRGSGRGSDAFKLLLERYSNKIFTITIESTAENCDNLPQRVRRREFYTRNGIRPCNLRVIEMGTVMEVMTQGENVTFEQLFETYTTIFGQIYARQFLPCN